jgi:hypothetical protein
VKEEFYMNKQSGKKPFTIVVSQTILVKNRKEARFYARYLRSCILDHNDRGVVRVLPETVRSEIEEELEIYADDFAS